MFLLLLDKNLRSYWTKSSVCSFLYRYLYMCCEKKSLSFKTSHFYFKEKNDDAHSLGGSLTRRHKQKSGLQTHVLDLINRWLNFFLVFEENVKEKKEGKQHIKGEMKQETWLQGKGEEGLYLQFVWAFIKKRCSIFKPITWKTKTDNHHIHCGKIETLLTWW